MNLNEWYTSTVYPLHHVLILYFFLITIYFIIFLSSTEFCYSAIHVCFTCFIISFPLFFHPPYYYYFLFSPISLDFLFPLPPFFLFPLSFSSFFFFLYFFLLLIQNILDIQMEHIFSKNRMTILKANAVVVYKRSIFFLLYGFSLGFGMSF